jgi:hypothetical protein
MLGGKGTEARNASGSSVTDFVFVVVQRGRAFGDKGAVAAFRDGFQWGCTYDPVLVLCRCHEGLGSLGIGIVGQLFAAAARIGELSDFTNVFNIP